ncbi:hypothetical protein [Segatella oulorum]
MLPSTNIVFPPIFCTANDGCALVGRAGRHTGTATTTLDDRRIPAKSFII